MIPFRPDIPPEVAELIRHLPPDIKRSIKQALRALSTNPDLGSPLRRELEGLRKYRVRRYRIVYAIDKTLRVLRVIAVGHRRGVYEDAARGLPKRE